ncbi:DNA repair and recombination protein RAD54-like 4 [Homarus americanus]|uniref:DNA repair and recombination protein RAD54-like 4 n=1 Tax=Homarus americanus TaxID=6706 RepID=A0A8J5MYV7_HOMAM|nr:DNA repair and recombination protein RAD54-like 4 [Homarus americanus]
MRRSHAPSQLLKRKNDCGFTIGPKVAVSQSDSKRQKVAEKAGPGLLVSPYRAPLVPIVNTPTGQTSSHEDLIRKILAKPFKIPIPNYVSRGSRCLGIRRNGVRRPLHDPDEPGALVLYSLAVLSAQEKLTANLCVLCDLAMPKRPAAKTPSKVTKRSRVAVTLDMKLDIVKRHEHGEGTSVIGRVHGLAPSTVHSIVKSADKIKEMARSATPLTATKMTRFRDAEIEYGADVENMD